MSLGHNCRFQSSQCNIQEITEFLLNILASFLVEPLFCALKFCIGICISWKVWFIYLNVCSCNGCSCRWVNVNKSKRMVSLVAKIEYVIINLNWMHEIMAGQKKKLRYSEETPWFPEYFGWIEIGNCDQETSNNYNKLVFCVLRVFQNMYLEQ